MAKNKAYPFHDSHLSRGSFVYLLLKIEDFLVC